MFVFRLTLLFLLSVPAWAQAQAPELKHERLQWLNNPELTCEQAKEQVQARYGVFGGDEAIPELLKKDLDIVADMLCSRRFAHCSFGYCESDKFLAPEVRQQLLKEQEEMRRKIAAQKQELINDAIAQEKRKRVKWERFQVPGDRDIKVIGQPAKKKTEAVAEKPRSTRRPWVRRRNSGF